MARLSRLSTSPARDVWPARSKRRPSVWCYWNRRRQELDRSLGHEDVGSTVVSIPIPSQKGMRRVHDLLRRRVPPLVSIPIPSEKGMRPHYCTVARHLQPVSIPIPSEKGMRPTSLASMASRRSLFQSPSPPRRGCAERGVVKLPGEDEVSIPIPSREGDAPRRGRGGLQVGHEVSIPIPSEKGMRQAVPADTVNLVDVSIPIPSEKGMRRQPLEVVEPLLEEVSIPIPSEKGMRRAPRSPVQG